MVESILHFAPLISATIVSGVLTIALVNFAMTRKNLQRQGQQQMDTLKIQTEQQIYARILEMRLKLENTDEFTNMAKESPVFTERFKLVDSPSEYYTAVAFFDLFEYVFRLSKMKAIDEQVWRRWQVIMEAIMTIPRFKALWDKTRLSHPENDFRLFMDSLNPIVRSG